MRIRLTAALLALVLCCAAAAADTDYGRTYEAALTLAGQDLTNRENVAAALSMLKETGAYLYSRSYSQYLEGIGELLGNAPDLNLVRLRFEIIGQAEAFETDLARRGMPSCSQLTAYVDARILEAAGDIQAAMTAYARMTVLDAPDRAWALGAAIAQGAPGPTPGPSAALVPGFVSSYGCTITDGVNLRASPSINSRQIKQLPVKTLVLILGTETGGTDSAMWYHVSVSGAEGYIRADMVRRMTVEELTAFVGGEAGGESPAPGGAEPSPSDAGYARTIVPGVPVRDLPGEHSSIIGWLPDVGTVVYVVGGVYDTDGAYLWYTAVYNDVFGCVRSDQLRMMNEAETLEYLNGLPVTPGPVSGEPGQGSPDSLSAYGYATHDNVNLRDGASSEGTRVLERLDRNRLCLVLGTQSVGTETWYHVSADGVEGYIHGAYFRQLTIWELSEFLRGGSPGGDGAEAAAAPAAGDPAAAPEWQPTPTEYIPWQPMPTPTPLGE